MKISKKSSLRMIKQADINISRIVDLDIKEADDNINFLLYTIGKSFVSTREHFAQE